MLSSETTSRRPIWSSLAPCRGKFLHTATLSRLIFLPTWHFVTIKMLFNHTGFFWLVAGYYTCSSRARLVWSCGQSVLWCWEASPWAPRTTSSPWWTVTSSLPFFKVWLHTLLMHANTQCLGQHLLWLAEAQSYRLLLLCCLQVSCVQTWSSLKLVFDVSERSS